VTLVGHKPKILDDKGYPSMLRGDLRRARAKFQAPLRLDPSNQTKQNNINRLDSSAKYGSRASE